MRCPRCAFEGEPIRGHCPRCGYTLTPVSAQPVTPTTSSWLSTRQQAFPLSTGSSFTSLQPLMRGDVLRNGRYRLVDLMPVPENQQQQGRAWAAIDNSSEQLPVIVREVIFPAEMHMTVAEQEQWLRSMAQHLTAVGQISNLPTVVDVFRERNLWFIVFLRPEGVSLSTVLAKQGGALPERLVATYGWQICDMLAELAALNPPLVHGSLSPDTIIVAPDGSDVSLIHLPLFPLEEQQNSSQPSSPYSPPEQARYPANPSTDLYALAAVMHHAVTGYDPRERVAYFYPPARRLNPAVSERLEAILSRQLRLSASQRYATPTEMQQDLTALLESYPPASNEPATLSVMNHMPASLEERQEQRRNATMLDAGVIAAIGVLLLIVTLFIVLHP